MDQIFCPCSVILKRPPRSAVGHPNSNRPKNGHSTEISRLAIYCARSSPKQKRLGILEVKHTRRGFSTSLYENGNGVTMMASRKTALCTQRYSHADYRSVETSRYRVGPAERPGAVWFSWIVGA